MHVVTTVHIDQTNNKNLFKKSSFITRNIFINMDYSKEMLLDVR